MKKLSPRAWISIITFLLIAIILFFARKELLHAWHLLSRVNLWILLLLIPVTTAGYLAAGEMIFSYLRQKKLIDHVSIWTQMRISLELNFVNHVLPSGGVSGISYMNWRLGKYGVPVGRATMAQVVRYVVGFGSIVALLVVAVLLVTVDGEVNRWIILMSSSLVSLLVILTMLGVYFMNNVPRMHRAADWVIRQCNRVVKWATFGKVTQVARPAQVKVFLDDMHKDYKGLMADKRLLVRPFLWGLFFTVTEVAIFWIVFWALGSPVNPAPILIAYGLASIVGMVVVTPGGAGAYEAVMVMVLAFAGMANGEAIAGIVLTRVIILLVTIGVGYVLYQQVVMKYGKHADADIRRK